MTNEDLPRCPLLQGLDPKHRAQLLDLLNNGCVREKVETCLTEFLQSSTTVPINAESQSPSPEKHVNRWQLSLPMRRSAKGVRQRLHSSGLKQIFQAGLLRITRVDPFTCSSCFFLKSENNRLTVSRVAPIISAISSYVKVSLI